ncbi:hypothetical protein L2E82_26939 [Cichorium intybus]|uniref:Uncharacterized protein n=1 Tax=Cichorium intybus TaxID=13427 RepID=A0ACB9CRK3_CICIN|nr:hypothetical protein L2E82_26939 [Cichorium intybus]
MLLQKRSIVTCGIYYVVIQLQESVAITAIEAICFIFLMSPATLLLRMQGTQLRFRDNEFKRANCGGHGFPRGRRRLLIIFPFTLLHLHAHSPLLSPAGKILLSIFDFALTSHSYCKKFTSIVNVYAEILELNNTNFSNCFLALKLPHIICSCLDDTPWDVVYADGSICLDILQNQWSPIYDVAAILISIQVKG